MVVGLTQLPEGPKKLPEGQVTGRGGVGGDSHLPEGVFTVPGGQE